jgi:hypothetical protein
MVKPKIASDPTPKFEKLHPQFLPSPLGSALHYYTGYFTVYRRLYGILTSES